MNLSILKDKNIFEVTEENIVTTFKKIFANNIRQGKLLEFNSIIKILKEEILIPEEMALNPESLQVWYKKIVTMSLFNDLFDDQLITEIMIDSSGKIFIDRNGIQQIETIYLQDIPLDLAFEVLALKENVHWNYSSPFCSFSTTINSHLFRATIIHGSSHPENVSKIFLRRFLLNEYPIESFISKVQTNNQEMNDNQIMQQINKMVASKSNIIIAGATSSGKTSFLRSMLNQVSSNEHVIVLEDTHEIMMKNNPNTTHMLAQNSTNKSLSDFCAYALRMRPDRIVLGEIRSAEIVPFVLSMNTGHRGMMASIHADSAIDTIYRLATLFKLYAPSEKIEFSTILKIISQNINYIIFMKDKKISEIISMIGVNEDTPIYESIYSLPATAIF